MQQIIENSHFRDTLNIVLSSLNPIDIKHLRMVSKSTQKNIPNNLIPILVPVHTILENRFNETKSETISILFGLGAHKFPDFEHFAMYVHKKKCYHVKECRIRNEAIIYDHTIKHLLSILPIVFPNLETIIIISNTYVYNYRKNMPHIEYESNISIPQSLKLKKFGFYLLINEKENSGVNVTIKVWNKLNHIDIYAEGKITKLNISNFYSNLTCKTNIGICNDIGKTKVEIKHSLHFPKTFMNIDSIPKINT